MNLLMWTPRARAEYYRYDVGARGFVVSKVRRTVEKHAERRDWHKGLRTVRGVDGEGSVYELRATASDRVLLRERSGHLVMLGVGDHDVVDRYVRLKSTQRQKDFESAMSAPREFDPSVVTPLYADFDSGTEVAFAEELDHTWLTFMAKQQSDVCGSLYQSILLSRIVGSGCHSAYLRGGAGTGKTVVLLNLAVQLHDAGVPVRLDCSPAMRRFLSERTRIDIRQLTDAPLSAGGVLLVDDPSSPWQVRRDLEAAADKEAAGVVLVFDPLQWTDKKAAAEYPRLPAVDHDITLTTCYRQSAELSKLALSMVESIYHRSSWRAAKNAVEVERAHLDNLLTTFLRDLTWAKSGGRVRTLIRPAAAVIQEEIDQRLLRWDRWTSIPQLLVLEDRARGSRLPRATRNRLTEAGIVFRTADFDDPATYKGLDFQSVWICISEALHTRVQTGETGLGSQEWQSMNNLHIALTRAKDETLVLIQ